MDFPLRCFKGTQLWIWKNKDGFRAIYKKPGENSQSTTRGKRYFIQVECLGKLHLTGVLVGRLGKVLQDKHKAASTNMDPNEAVKLSRALNNYVSSLRDVLRTFRRKGRSKLVLKMSRCTKEILKERNKEVWSSVEMIAILGIFFFFREKEF